MSPSRKLKSVALNHGFWIMDLERDPVLKETNETIKCVGFKTAKKSCSSYLEDEHKCAIYLNVRYGKDNIKFYLACEPLSTNRVTISYVYEDSSDNYFAGSAVVTSSSNLLFDHLLLSILPNRAVSSIRIRTDVDFNDFSNIFYKLIQKQILEQKDN